MIPKIYDQVVSNFPSHTWLKQTCNEERENDEIVAIEFRLPQVVSRAALVAPETNSPASSDAVAAPEAGRQTPIDSDSPRQIAEAAA